MVSEIRPRSLGRRGAARAAGVLLAVVLAILLSPAASAQTCTTVRVEMAPADAAKAAASMVVRIPAPGGVVMAVGDTQGLLAVGSIAGTGTTRAKVSLYTLGGDGAAALSTAFELPVDPQLDKNSTRPVGLAFHPRLPLLYVWQELIVPPSDVTDAKKPYVKEKFFRGLIYQLGGGAPKLVESFANNWQFDFCPGNYNSLALAPSGKRLFVPSAYMGDNGPGSATALAFFELGDDGLTLKADDKTTPTLVRQPWGDAVTYGWGFVPVKDDVVVIASRIGITTWDIDNRLARYTTFYLNVGGTTVRLGGDPDGPAVYASSVASGNAFSMLQVDGYITLIPKMISLPLPLVSRPVPMSKRKVVALPVKDHVYLAGVDANGEFNGKVTDVASLGFQGACMGYSQKSDRLYITVETAQ